MRNIRLAIALAGVAALAAGLAGGQQESKGEAKKAGAAKKGGGGGGMLHPDWAPDGGYDKAMGPLGEKPAQPWSATTIGAAINGKPQPGNVKTVTGEIIDFSCYLQLGKHGEKHRSCGQKCLTAGQPIGLLTKDGNLYMLMEEEHDPRRDGQTAGFRKAATEHLAHVMEVTGTEATVRGYRALFVTGYVNK